jgi:cytochrome c biogenesis protein CcmG, thiol:disulfide interchange protein DsbE
MMRRPTIPPLQIAAWCGVCTVFLLVFTMRWEPRDSESVLRSIAALQGQWVDRPAPHFELVDLQGRTHRLSDYRGKVVFLNFWASFCEPCRREMPSMERLVRQYEPQGMEMIAISLDPELPAIQTFMNEFLPGQRSAMTVLWDPKSESSARYGTDLLPETYIIDREGRTVARFVNAYDWTRPEVKRLIEALLRGQHRQRRYL